MKKNEEGEIDKKREKINTLDSLRLTSLLPAIAEKQYAIKAKS